MNSGISDAKELNDRIIKLLKCAACQHYLTPPLIQCKKGDTICGECAGSSKCNACNSELLQMQSFNFESVLNSLSFPCRYKDAGCEEYSPWTQLLAHETECYLRVYDCPVKQTEDCSWQGQGNEIKTHFENEHRSLMLISQNGMYSMCLDLTTTYHKVFMVSAFDEVFLFHKARNPVGSVSVGVQYVGNKIDCENYNYKISVKKSSSKLELSQNEQVMPDSINALDHTNTIHINDLLLLTLQEDPVVKCDFFISKIESVPSVTPEIFNKLKCPVCLEYMQQVISLCDRGHSFCFDCRLQIQFCPICRGALGSARNYALEVVCQTIQFP